jgi:hypothetical protein
MLQIPVKHYNLTNISDAKEHLKLPNSSILS